MMKNFLADLRTKAWRTSGARYNAARRLKRRDWFATFSIAVFSAVGVALAIIQKVYGFEANSAIDRYLTALSVVIGLFVIVISLIEWGYSPSVKAEALHRNAEQLNSFQFEVAQHLASQAEPSEEVVTRLRKKYEEIKQSCPVNHDPVDDALFRAQQRFSPEYTEKDAVTPKMGWLAAMWAETLSLWSIGKSYYAYWAVLALLLYAAWVSG
jgi:hypothetical protein